MRKPTHPIPSNRRAERGVAIVFVTFAIAALLVAISGALVTGAANSRATSNYKGASQIHFVAESGISSRSDVTRLAPSADAFLVGSSLMAAAFSA